MSPASPGGEGLGAKRARLASLDEFARETSDGFRSTQARREADNLRAEIARDEADEGKVSQPDEVTRRQLDDVYARLADRPGALVSLARLRRELAHIPASDLDRVLKQMDRERLLQLEPDPNQKAIGDEGQAAAIWLGGEKMHFVTMRRKA